MVHALTVDVEDWKQSVWDNAVEPSDRFVSNTQRVMDLLDAFDVRATFFVLGVCARHAPELVREISDRGHDVQSHGYGHVLLTRLRPSAIARDLDSSKKLLEDITGARVRAYRAPAFSVTEANLWVLDLIAEAGYEIDASIFPIRMPRYGIGGVPRSPYRVTTPSGYELIEVPVATGSLLGWRVPIGGGGYLRLLPARLISAGLRQLERTALPACLYMHPYEVAASEMGELAREIAIPLKQRLHQGLGRGGFAEKLRYLLSHHNFGTIGDLLASTARAAKARHGSMPREPMPRPLPA